MLCAVMLCCKPTTVSGKVSESTGCGGWVKNADASCNAQDDEPEMLQEAMRCSTTVQRILKFFLLYGKRELQVAPNYHCTPPIKKSMYKIMDSTSNQDLRRSSQIHSRLPNSVVLLFFGTTALTMQGGQDSVMRRMPCCKYLHPRSPSRWPGLAPRSGRVGKEKFPARAESRSAVADCMDF